MVKLLILVTLVIINPYEGLNYDEINVYEIDEKCVENCIGYTQSEFMEQEDDYEIEVIQER